MNADIMQTEFYWFNRDTVDFTVLLSYRANIINNLSKANPTRSDMFISASNKMSVSVSGPYYR